MIITRATRVLLLRLWWRLIQKFVHQSKSVFKLFLEDWPRKKAPDVLRVCFVCRVQVRQRGFFECRLLVQNVVQRDAECKASRVAHPYGKAYGAAKNARVLHTNQHNHTQRLKRRETLYKTINGGDSI